MSKKIVQNLHKSLEILNEFENCALLDYPNHLNIGDHLIWIGAIFYLLDIAKTRIDYTASISNFSHRRMQDKVGQSPIIFTGGGNLGDLWSAHQNFREQIIAHYRDRPIIILPQSIYFSSLDNLEKAANVFNSHPQLTLFIRDQYSYKIAQNYFSNCQIIHAPDMALQLINFLNLKVNNQHNNQLLYHCRQDIEANEKFSPHAMQISNLLVEDWVSFDWVFGNPNSKLMQSIAYIIRESWQRSLKTPQEWSNRQQWQKSHAYIAKLNHVYNPKLHYHSWSFIHSGIYQFSQYRLIITNRLHGHILCTILKIPHVFLPNFYHKNQSFYESWTKQIPFCRFIQDPLQVKPAVQELLELFPLKQ
jgi:pyruvyl transferase EpsO